MCVCLSQNFFTFFKNFEDYKEFLFKIGCCQRQGLGVGGMSPEREKAATSGDKCRSAEGMM